MRHLSHFLSRGVNDLLPDNLLGGFWLLDNMYFFLSFFDLGRWHQAARGRRWGEGGGRRWGGRWQVGGGVGCQGCCWRGVGRDGGGRDGGWGGAWEVGGGGGGGRLGGGVRGRLSRRGGGGDGRRGVRGGGGGGGKWRTRSPDSQVRQFILDLVRSSQVKSFTIWTIESINTKYERFAFIGQWGNSGVLAWIGEIFKLTCK